MLQVFPRKILLIKYTAIRREEESTISSLIPVECATEWGHYNFSFHSIAHLFTPFKAIFGMHAERSSNTVMKYLPHRAPTPWHTRLSISTLVILPTVEVVTSPNNCALKFEYTLQSHLSVCVAVLEMSSVLVPNRASSFTLCFLN